MRDEGTKNPGIYSTDRSSLMCEKSFLLKPNILHEKRSLACGNAQTSPAILEGLRIDQRTRSRARSALPPPHDKTIASSACQKGKRQRANVFWYVQVHMVNCKGQQIDHVLWHVQVQKVQMVDRECKDRARLVLVQKRLEDLCGCRRVVWRVAFWAIV